MLEVHSLIHVEVKVISAHVVSPPPSHEGVGLLLTLAPVLARQLCLCLYGFPV